MGLSHFCMPHEQSHGTPFGSDYLFKDRMFLKEKYRHASVHYLRSGSLSFGVPLLEWTSLCV